MPDPNAQRCLACGAPLDTPAQKKKIKCPYCHTVNVVGPQEKEKGDNVLCPECGAGNPKEAQHCGHCGFKLKSNCPKCRAPNPYGTVYCMQCGIDIQGEIERQEEEKRRVEEERRLREEKAQRRQEEDLRRSAEERRLREEEERRRQEEERKESKRQSRKAFLLAAGTVGVILLCVAGSRGLDIYKNDYSPQGRQTQTAVMLKRTEVAAEQTAAPARKTATAEYFTLFHDDFSSPDSGWARYSTGSGSASYESGGLRMQAFRSNAVFWATAPNLLQESVRVEVDATWRGEPGNSYLGIICRYQDAANFYYLVISDDGFAAVYRFREGRPINISSDANRWYAGMGISAGSPTNHLRADCIGSKLTLYTNGVQTIRVTDDSLQTGNQVGLIAGVFDEGRTDVVFKNFCVYRP